MKRTLALTLAALMLAAAVCGCTTAPTATAAISANIRMTSSDAESAAAWLSSRLGEALTERIVLGTDADGYGVDVSSLEDDGYFIRSLGDEVALFARTTDGLDRAARKYAHAVESGVRVIDETCREGARIKSLKIAGRDIAEYTVYCEDEANMLAAAGTFTARIAEACGAKLAVVTDAPATPYIAIRYVRDDALGNVGYRWSVDADGLTVECSDVYKQNSANAALTRFLVRRLDWLGLDFGFEDLPAADLIDIKAGESGGETPCFDWARPTSGQFGEYLDNYGLALGERTAANAGVAEHRLGASLSVNEKAPWNFDQPCWLDEDF